MRIVTALTVFCCAVPGLAAGPAASSEVRNRNLQYRVARWVHPSIAEDQKTLRSLSSRLQRCLPLAPGSRGAGVGYHSRFYDSPDRTIDIVLDLGKTRAVDRLAVFPVSTIFQGEIIDRYGFPARFRIEAANDAEFKHSELLTNSAELGPVVRPLFPVQVATPGLSARFIRMRVLRHWNRSDGRYLTALGEMMVLSGGRNVAIHAKVDAPSFASLPDWSRENLVDGQTDLGLPIGPEPSVTNGFLSVSSPIPEARKWVELDFPGPTPIEEVRLIPAKPFDAPSQHGHGFPRRFRVIASIGPDFASREVIADHTEIAFPNPGDNPVILRADGITASAIRLEAEELWHVSQQRYSLALAEFQVYSEGRNIAATATVSASDVFARPPFDRVWKPEFLTDGFSSQNRLTELDQWLEGLEQREEMEREFARIQSRVRQRVESTTSALLMLAVGLIATLAAFALFSLGRRKQALAAQRDEMRARIARDLHDDLGSRLGGMRLISESMLTNPGLPASMHDDIGLIHRASQEATDAMRDIVWLLDNSESSRAKLIRHIREMTPSILGGMEFDFTVDDAPEQQLDFDFRRQVLFAFKECLANTLKHAEANRVDCHFGGDAKRFTFDVRDDGRGFSVEGVEGGYGLRNLSNRAHALDGSVTLSSKPGEGTRVLFDVPVKIKRS